VIPTAHAVISPSGEAYATAVVVEAVEAPPAHVHYVSEADKVAYLRRGAHIGPAGLVEQFRKSVAQFGMRYWIIDNSGSMNTCDGRRFVSAGHGRWGAVSATRWEELGDSLEFHAAVAAHLGAPTEFRLLNPPAGAPQVVPVGRGDPEREIDAMKHLAASSPLGRTPLCARVREVIRDIRARESQLRAAGTRALVVIASDGEPSDGSVEEALRPLKDLPCWVVVRLCTDDDAVVGFWNRVDADLEVDMDVLDDLTGEAREVAAHNPWLTYGLSLHRLREFGCVDKIFDVLDETRLSKPQVLHCVKLLYGDDVDVPHPDLNFEAFARALDALQRRHDTNAVVWNPLKNRSDPWINVRVLSRQLGHGCSIM